MEEGSEGLPERIVDRLAEMMGGEPTEDDALISAIKDIGRSHEKHLKEKERLQGSNSGEDSGKKHKKRKRGEPSDASAQDSVPAGKKQQAGNSKGSGSGKKGETPRFTREQEEEALRVSLRPYEMRGSGRSSASAVVWITTCGSSVGRKSLYLRQERRLRRRQKPPKAT